MQEVPKPYEAFSRDRMKDKELAQILGYSNFAMKIIGPPKGVPGDSKYLLLATPPHPVMKDGKPCWEKVEVPCWHTDINAAIALGLQFGLAVQHRRAGFMVRPTAAFAADPRLDAYCDEGEINGPATICKRIIRQMREALNGYDSV